MTPESLALLNFVLNAMTGWACLCRLNLSHSGVLSSVRLKYTAFFTGATASGLQPLLFNEWPGEAQTFVSFTVMVAVLASAQRWRNGAPRESLKSKGC